MDFSLLSTVLANAEPDVYQVNFHIVLIMLKKGKPVEKQGRKVSDLRGNTYDSGAAGLLWMLL